MSYILSIYSNVAFKEYILPSIDNADYDITIRNRDFAINNDIKLKLEVLTEQWSIKKNSEYTVSKNNERIEGIPLEDSDVIQLITADGEQLTVIVRKVAAVFHSFDKYMLGSIKSISIGKAADNDICYDFLGMVSKKHAEIVKTGEGYEIRNYSSNGIYVNSEKIENSKTLEFGAYINIVGLHMVFLGNMLAVDSFCKAMVKPNALKKYAKQNASQIFQKDIPHNTAGERIYHRAPRNYEKIGSGVIEIEEPPQKQNIKKQSLLMTVAPSLMMALPMLLGCAFMIYASQSAGGSSLYMYSGLFMSVSSAFAGVIWGIVNLNMQKKEEAELEKHRFEAYSEYLVEKTDEIKVKYEETEKRLNLTYPEINISLDDSSGVLWGRNYTHSDFLCERLGTGEKEFQYNIEIPKKRFKLYKDELSEKPEFIKSNYKTLYNVPLTVDLLSEKLIGIVGGKNKNGAVETAKIIASQIAVNNCYTDVKLGFIYNGESSQDCGRWEFAKWLPHVWSEDHNTRFVASTKEEAGEVFHELTRVARERINGEGNIKKNGTIPKPYYIIFISDMSMLEGELFSKYVFSQDEECGITTIILTERNDELPNECEFIIENTETFKGMYHVNESPEERQKITFDVVDDDKLLKFARKVSSLKVAEMEEGGEIPNSISFFEMLGVGKIEEFPVIETWAKSRTYENIKGQLGEKVGGVPCYLDLHEKYHGPHGLVAGTTGSGKSETLQTYILSLAVNYSPDDIGFFIIDYKGGGMANLFDGLPHMIGQISNLSGNQVRRAMISIKSENKRRQRIFSENGVNNINLYTKLYKSGEAKEPIPHLMIIIDEFAELKREEPEFMRELISVAQVGRSLGVHLILATQKPSGTVDDNIWSNSKFRLCLRVQDQQDSKDMLHKPDAAYITQPGRGYLQVGSDEVYELFQSGFSGAVYDETMASTGNKEIVKLISLSGKVDMTGNRIKRLMKKHSDVLWIEKLCGYMDKVIGEQTMTASEITDINQKVKFYTDCLYDEFEEEQLDYSKNEYNTARLIDFVLCYLEAVAAKSSLTISERIFAIAKKRERVLPKAKEKTQLDVVKDYLAKLAEENNYNHKITLWLPVLKENIYLDEFEEFVLNSYQWGEWHVNSEERNLKIIIGQMDDPENQNQMPLSIDFLEEGNVAICGMILCGKSTMMQTMVYELIHRFTPDIVNIYCIDFSNKMLASFEEAPHVGGIIYEGEYDKISKFFNMIMKILEERKKVLKGGNYKQYVQTQNGDMPAIMLFIDNYGAFKEKTEEAYEEDMIRLAKEGVSMGIYLVISGAGFGMNEISNRIAENIQRVLCLELKDKYEYADYLHDMHIEVLPESNVKGRGLAKYGDRILEYQTLLAFRAANNYVMQERIKDICEEMKSVWKGERARKIPEIPQNPTWTDFRGVYEYKQMLNSKDYVAVGYDERNAEVYGISLRQIYCYMICGANRTGKTNFMRVFIQSAIEKQSRICIIDSPKQELKMYRNEELDYLTDEKEMFEFFGQKLGPVFKERNIVKKNLIEEEKDEDEIYNVQREQQPFFIFISDLGWFFETVYSSEFEMKGFLETLFEKGRLHNIYFVGELSIASVSELQGYRGFNLFSDYHQGIHFGGKTVDNRLLSFDYMSYTEQSQSEKAGTGQLPDITSDDEASRIIVPLARK